MKTLYPLLVTAVATLAGCASFRPTAVEDVPFKERAQSQTEGDVTVRAVVLGAEETEAVFGAPLYKRGIQPIWLEITNNDDININHDLNNHKYERGWGRGEGVKIRDSCMLNRT